jgi:hypothetical protein
MYYFHFKNDVNMEPIAYIKASSHVEAINHFAKLKNMSIDMFQDIFSVNIR